MQNENRYLASVVKDGEARWLDTPPPGAPSKPLVLPTTALEMATKIPIALLDLGGLGIVARATCATITSLFGLLRHQSSNYEM